MTDITDGALMERKMTHAMSSIYRIRLNSAPDFYLYASTEPKTGVYIWLKYEGVDIDTKGTTLADLDNLIKVLFMTPEMIFCEDCGEMFEATKEWQVDLSVCDDCLNEYPNETGHCSPYCRVSGVCDESC